MSLQPEQPSIHLAWELQFTKESPAEARVTRDSIACR